MATHNLDLLRRSDYRTIEMNRGQIVFDSSEAAQAAIERLAE
jgi:ABC-type ATPase involved in cell division